MSDDVLHYRGDRTKFDPDQIYGPDMFGAYWAPIKAIYEAERDRTAITFRPIPPAELRERFLGGNPEPKQHLDTLNTEGRE